MGRKLKTPIDSSVDIDILSEFFYAQKSQIRKWFRKGNKIDKAYEILTNTKLTNGQKRKILYSSSLQETIKDTLYERYMGDKGFKYNDSSSLDEKLEF